MLLKKLFTLILKHLVQNYVINRSNWGSEGNLELLEKYFDKKLSF